MNILELIRLEESKNGTIGVLKINKQVFCFTLEPSDRENISNVSSIPAQQYLLTPYVSAKHPDTYQVIDVPGRTLILIHAGNIVDHTAGCILVGSGVGKLSTYPEKRAILNSGITFNLLLNVLKTGNNNHLTISEVY